MVMGAPGRPQAPGSERSTFTQVKRRDQLVDCAIDAIAELGFARASVAEVARRPGVSKGVVTYHFPAKDDLIGAVIADVLTSRGSTWSLASTPRTPRSPRSGSSLPISPSGPGTTGLTPGRFWRWSGFTTVSGTSPGARTRPSTCAPMTWRLSRAC
jgi:hypothetical protein